jgi:hypothetical protein
MNLIQGNYYEIKHSGEFCHAMGNKGTQTFSKGLNYGDQVTVQFVGTVKTELGLRHIFFDQFSNKRKYYMYAAENEHTYILR